MAPPLDPKIVEEYVNSTGEIFKKIWKRPLPSGILENYLRVRCQHCKKPYSPRWGNFKKGGRCLCQKGQKIKARYAKYKIPYETIKEYIEKRGYKLLTTQEKYTDSHQILSLECPKGHFPEINYVGFKNDRRCGFCFRESQVRSLEDFIKKSEEIHPGQFDYSEFVYEGNKIPGKIICKACGKSFERNSNDHFKPKSSCPHCTSSAGEKELAEYLDSQNISYESEVPLKNTRQRWDFFLTKSEIYIEFNGEQHYKIINYFGKLRGYCSRVRNDLNKLNWALNNEKILFIFMEYGEYSGYTQYIDCLDKNTLLEASLTMIYNHCERLYDYLEDLDVSKWNTDKDQTDELEGFPYDELDKVYLRVKSALKEKN
jgi:rubrerythrin